MSGQGTLNAESGKRTMSKSKYQFYQEASLSQKLADKLPLYQQLAGTDKDISDSIAVLSYLYDPDPKKRERREKLRVENPIQWMIGLLDVLRMSAFATSEKTNEITKMGMQMPKAEDEISKF